MNQIPQLTYRVRIDSLGYRGQDFPRSKAGGELRILFVGDSFVFGTLVDNDETLPSQTERELGSRCEAAVRVVNAGLGGSTITEQVRMIERGLTLDPDLVILQFYENDISDLAGPVMWDQLAANRRTKGRFPLSVLYPFLRRTALANLALRAVSRIRERNVAERYSPSTQDGGSVGGSEAQPSEGSPTAQANQFRLQYAEWLGRLQTSLADRGIPLLVTVMPSHLSVYGDQESERLEWFDGLAAELEIEAVSFFPTFVADGRSNSELYLLPYDGHASAEGYRIAAQRLAGALTGLDPLSRHCS